MRKFGLIGYPLGHSFSKKYFSEKFDREGLSDCSFELFELSDINQFPDLLKNNPTLHGLSVTIPYKEQVIQYLDKLDPKCAKIGAVNCIQISEGQLTGYNTDYIGFKNSLEKWLKGSKPNALILGTGGASKAVAEALKTLKITYKFVSRTPDAEQLDYETLKQEPKIFAKHHLIINTTPLGTYPNIAEMPSIDPEMISDAHHLYDLVYNPQETFLMRSLEARGAVVKNGLEMLELQAEAAWQIWN